MPVHGSKDYSLFGDNKKREKFMGEVWRGMEQLQEYK